MRERTSTQWAAYVAHESGATLTKLKAGPSWSQIQATTGGVRRWPGAEGVTLFVYSNGTGQSRGAPRMSKGRYVSYLRVSTDRQGRSGLGLEAQRKAVEDFLNGGRWDLIAELLRWRAASGTTGRSLPMRCPSAGCTMQRW